MARPTKLTAKITEAVCDAIREGLSIEGACSHAGIARSTFHDWVSRGEDGEAEFSDFADQTARARAEVEERLLGSIEWAAGKRMRRRALGTGSDFETFEEEERDWRAAAWLLERKFPEAYGNKQTLEHTGKDGGPIGVSVDARERLEDLLKRSGGNDA